MDETGIMVWLLVGLGGASGAVLRVWISSAVQIWWGTGFPLGTFVVNMAGSWAIGVALGWLSLSDTDSLLRGFIISGVLGAFTTFSTFSLDNLHLLEVGNLRSLIVNVPIQLIAGITLVWLGFQITVWMWT